jgi:hypothetical protein
LAGVAGILLFSVAYAFQRPWREYPAFEYEAFPIPPDYQEKTEWLFARLMYPPVYGNRFGDWREGHSHWTMDYPRSDRHFSAALRRLTRIHVRSVEQPVNLDDGDEVFYYPFLYWRRGRATEPHRMRRPPSCANICAARRLLHVRRLPRHLRVEVFTNSRKRVFPDRPIVDIENSDQIFHTLYDLDDRYQVPGAQFLRSRQTYEFDGVVPRWRGIYDDKGRLMVAICHNMDLGDSWEHADNPEYPAKFSDLGIRIGVNYVVYAMTH